MDTKIILVCEDNEEKNTYLDALESLTVSVEAVSSFKNLESLLLEDPYHGVMVDMKTKIRAIRNEKELAYQILDKYPVVQLRIDEETGEIRTLSDGKSRHDATLEEFIEADCRRFEARAIRSSPRAKYHFNVLLSKTEKYSEDNCERTITFNVSKGGCFIISCREWKLKQQVSFRIKDIEDQARITGDVRWYKPWGKSVGIPGIGVQINDIKENQFQEICEKGRIK